MKTTNKLFSKIATPLALLILVNLGCERDISDEAVQATFSTNQTVFSDTFSAGLEYYPYADSKFEAFSVDTQVKYQGTAPMRFDVPNEGDRNGAYAGAIFRIDGPGRNLTSYDALTFYVKASTGIQLGDVGYGIDYLENKYQVSTQNINVGTNWTKVIIPIPDPSKLTNERGVFWFAAGTQGTNGAGYALWFDEIKFEKLGTVGKPTSNILNGETNTIKSFIGSTINITGLNHVYNLVNGQDVTVNSTPAYYAFKSSNPTVASVNDSGIVKIISSGTSEITATLNGIKVNGKLIVESKGNLPSAPQPTQPQNEVKSIFSDAYVNATESNFTPGFGGSTSVADILLTSSGKVLQYGNNNFTGIIFNNTIDASTLGFLHIDAYVENASTSIGIQIRDIGSNKTIETDIFTGNPIGDDKDKRSTLTGFQSGVWKSFDIPLNGAILNQKNNLGAIIITGGPNFILDNIYFYK
jgi:hypothetical protein